MPIPDYQSCMLPLLRLASDGEIHKFADSIETLSEQFKLTPEERQELLPSGTQFIIANRIGWARTYMKKAGLLFDPKRGHFQITERGKDLIKTNPKAISSKMLRQYEEFNVFQNKSNSKVREEEQSIEPQAAYPTPEEALEYGYQKLEPPRVSRRPNPVGG
jgi:restriction system protein